ncbi:prolyl oligopeptidase family serine peptidase [Propionibacteriaceae bacterium G1746]
MTQPPAPPITAPYTERDDTVETLHGRRIADPYRWLEDPDSPRTRAWVDAQRDYCEQVFAGVKGQAWFTDTMNRLLRRPRVGTPDQRGGWYTRLVNDGTRDHDLLVGAHSLDDLVDAARARVLLDPNTWSADGTTALVAHAVSPDGRLLAHHRSEAGSDWTTIRLLDLATGELRGDRVMAKFSRAEWLPDSSGFIYSTYPQALRNDGVDPSALEVPHLMLHRVATDGVGAQSADDIDLLSFPDAPGRMMRADIFTSPSQDWLVLWVGQGTNRANAVWLAPLVDGPAGQVPGDWVEFIADELHERLPIGIVGDELLLQTDERAPMGQVVAVGLPGTPAAGRRRVVVPQSDDVLEHTLLAAGPDGDHVLVTCHLVDVSPRLRRWSVAHSTLLGDVDVDGGALVALNGDPDQTEVFIGMSTVTTPTASSVLDAATGEVVPIAGAGDTTADDLPEVSVTPPTITRHRTPSTGGVEVPYFLIRPAGASSETGPAPTIVYGYGGFSLPVLANYSPGWAGWLAAGGTLVIANLRGGSEFGAQWYEDGRRAHKQHVFDDFIAVSEHLVSTGVTDADHLVAYGRSNGGLLVGATLVQRPDLFAAAIPQVGVLDLLRFHKFTIGAAWSSDYGNPDDPDDFAVALAYSPLHNIVGADGDQRAFPPTLVVTGDHDDRVVPAHSHKFTATLQAAQADPDAPIVSRIEVATGHGVGKPIGMQAAEWADILAFAAHHAGLPVPE